MKNFSAKQKIGSIGIFGLFTLIGLEYHVSPDQHLFVLLPIVFAGIGRFYLFVEGSTMEDEKDRQIAFGLSIGLAIAFIAYVIILKVYDVGGERFKGYHLALFLITSFTLLAVEWVFGQRSGYTRKNAINLRDKQSKRLMGIARKYKGAIDSLTARVGSLESEINGLNLSISNLKNQINTLKSKPDYSGFLGHWLIEGNSRFRISKCCGAKSVLPSNRSTSLKCSNCGNEIWNKERETA